MSVTKCRVFYSTTPPKPKHQDDAVDLWLGLLVGFVALMPF